jgi:hypothetical protein
MRYLPLLENLIPEIEEMISEKKLLLFGSSGSSNTVQERIKKETR